MASHTRSSDIPPRELFENHPLPMWVFDLETLAFLAVNAAAIRQYGYSRQQFLAMSIREIRPPEELPALAAKLSRPSEGHHAAGTWRHRKRDGTIIDVEIVTHTLSFAGRPAKLVMATDVTAQKRAEKRWRDLVLQQEAILDNIPDIAWLKDEQSRFVAVNEPFRKAAGFASAALLGKTDLEVWPRDLAERYRADDREVMRSGSRKVVEEPLVDKEGNTTWIETIKTPIIDAEGRVVGTTGIARDITARRQAEEALRRKDQVLSEAQRIAHIGSWQADFKTGRVVWSEEMHRIYGTSPRTFQPTPQSYLRLVDPRDRRAMLQWIRATAAGRRYENLEFRIVRPDGAQRWLRGSIEPLLDAAGLPVGAIGTGQDITETKQHTEELLDQKAFTEHLLQGSSVATFVINDRREVILWNKACEALTGVPAAEMIGTTRPWEVFYEAPRPVLAELVLDRDPETLSRLYPAASLSVLVPEGLHAESWIADLNGKDRYIVFDAAPIRDGSGRVIAAIETIQDLTSRRRAEEAIAASEERYRSLFDNANDMIQSVAPDGRFLYVNAAWRKVLGYDQDDLRSLTLFDIVDPSCMSSCREQFARAMSGEPIDFLEAKFVAKNKRVVDLEGSASVHRGGGKVVSTQVIFRDVTEHKKLQEEIYRISHDWEETFDTLTDMVTVHDEDFTIVRANKAAEQILGLPFLAVKKVKCFEYFHGTACPPAGCPSCASILTGQPSVNEIFEPHLGRHLEIRAIPRVDSSNRIVGLIHVVRDITERKRNEESIERYGRDLASLNTASNTLMLITSLDGIYQEICNIIFTLFDLKLVWFGVVEKRDFAVRPVAHAGRDDGYLKSIQVRWDDSPLGMGPTGIAVKTKTTVKARSSDPSFGPWQETAERRGYAASMAVPLIDPHGECTGVLNFSSDDPDYFTPDKERLCQIFANQAAIAVENSLLIAGLEEKVFARTFELESANVELQHLNRELELRRLQAESASRTKSDFLANMSHELRTPLNAIIGFSDLLVRGMAGPLPEKPKEYLGDILGSGRHLLSLINDILDLSKVEAGRMELELTEFDPADLIDRSLLLFREKAAKHRLDLRAEIGSAIEPLFGDERKIRQVIYNLLSNAVKFTPDGGAVVVRARTVRESGRDCAEISVSDTGIGISSEDQQRLFQPFSQLSHHLTKDHEGTGLGLALCKSFVEMHGGLIRVESAPGQGSTFTFSLPHGVGRGSA